MNNNQIQFKCVFRYSLVKCRYYYCGALSIPLNGSSDGRDVSPLATPATSAFSHPYMRWRFPTLLVKWLYRLTSQVACKGFKTDNLRSTSMSSSFPIISNYRSVLNFAYPNFSESLISRFFTNRENHEIKASRKLVRIRYNVYS